MHAKVCAAAACQAAAMRPERAAAIAAQTVSGPHGWGASLRHALLAFACVLGTAPAALGGTPVSAPGPASAAPGADTTSRADSASSASPTISQRDATVRQVVLGIVSFTHWPTAPTHLHLCVTGRPDYARGLIDPLQAGSTPLDVQRVGVDSPVLGSACDVVYFGNLSDDERQEVRDAVAGHPVLTISEHSPSCTTGSMFCLNVDDEHVTFAINLDAMARSGVRVDPNVLKLGRRPMTP